MKQTNSSVQEISVTRNSASLTLGIISIVIAVLALLVSWVPFLGLIAIPAAIVALLLSGIGILIALVKRGKGLLMPVLGGFLSILPIAVSVGTTGATSSAIGSAIDEANAIEAEKMESALAGLEIEDIKWGVESSFGDPNIIVSYKVRNGSDINIKTVTTRVRFYDAEGNEIGHEQEFPVSMLDSDLHPGNVIEKDSNMFDYPDIPAKSVKSVSVKVENITVD